MLQAMTPTALRLQIVRGLAQLTQTSPSEIEVLFELSKPVALNKIAPPRGGRPQAERAGAANHARAGGASGAGAGDR